MVVATELTVGAVLSTVSTLPVANVTASGFSASSVIAGVRLARSSRMVPSPVPRSTVTVRVAPLPVTLVMDGATENEPVVVRKKFVSATPKTA